MSKPQDSALLLTIAEAAEQLRISESRMYQLISRYGIPTVDVGAGTGRRPRTRISRKALEEFIESRTDYRTPTGPQDASQPPG